MFQTFKNTDGQRICNSRKYMNMMSLFITDKGLNKINGSLIISHRININRKACFKVVFFFVLRMERNNK